MPCKKLNHDDKQSSRMTPGVGYVNFVEFSPIFPDAKSAGGIALPASHVLGQSDHSQATWGRVVSCGPLANRASCEPFEPAVQERQHFPLKQGTWIIFRKANAWTVHGPLKALQTCDIVNSFPADMTWGEVRDEILTLQSSFKE